MDVLWLAGSFFSSACTKTDSGTAIDRQKQRDRLAHTCNNSKGVQKTPRIQCTTRANPNTLKPCIGKQHPRHIQTWWARMPRSCERASPAKIFAVSPPAGTLAHLSCCHMSCTWTRWPQGATRTRRRSPTGSPRSTLTWWHQQPSHPASGVPGVHIGAANSRWVGPQIMEDKTDRPKGPAAADNIPTGVDHLRQEGSEHAKGSLNVHASIRAIIPCLHSLCATLYRRA